MVEAFTGIGAGIALPEIVVDIDREALVRYAGASDDYVRQHWDYAFMIENGYPDVLAHGWLTMAHMCRVVTDWAPHDAGIAGYAVRYHQPLYPGALRCGGEVERVEGDKAMLALWGRNAAGETVASAALTLLRVA
jgi:acyl dehydratase